LLALIVTRVLLCEVLLLPVVGLVPVLAILDPRVDFRPWLEVSRFVMVCAVLDGSTLLSVGWAAGTWWWYGYGGMVSVLLFSVFRRFSRAALSSTKVPQLKYLGCCTQSPDSE
jgi:hypothetical protein